MHANNVERLVLFAYIRTNAIRINSYATMAPCKKGSHIFLSHSF